MPLSPIEAEPRLTMITTCIGPVIAFTQASIYHNFFTQVAAFNPRKGRDTIQHKT